MYITNSNHNQQNKNKEHLVKYKYGVIITTRKYKEQILFNMNIEYTYYHFLFAYYSKINMYNTKHNEPKKFNF